MRINFCRNEENYEMVIEICGEITGLQNIGQ